MRFNISIVTIGFLLISGCAYTNLYYELKENKNNFSINKYDSDIYVYENQDFDISIGLPGNRKKTSLGITNKTLDSLIVEFVDFSYFGENGELSYTRKWYQLNEAGSSIPEDFDFKKKKAIIFKDKYFWMLRDIKNSDIRKNKSLVLKVNVKLIIEGTPFHFIEEFEIIRKEYHGWYIGLD